ncbi:MAG: DNA helicase RecQ [Sutterella sp.]|uniref:DNA helicase RecQ n=1 Tax=uncultured Duodenibacillus sp. TaxID=1980699 RepID=UPI00258559C0|nr:DNA helicase RecQ [uncultured Duodenibacillus sp.]MBE5702288.1 DNA helicase RecQ [Sutterella sp.]
MAQTAQDILESVFGLTAFRGFQKDVIETVAAGGDALVLMPTGGGKSLCYQIPALMRSGMAVVVSPLIALMADQVRALSDAGVKAAYINSTLAWPEVADIKRRAAAGDVDILYVAPERLVLESTLQFLSTVRLSLFAIDEAHCVSMWGHDFRPEYAQLSVLRERWPEVPRIALTATADLATREEICERLLVNPKRFVASFDRPNIRYRIVEKDHAQRQLTHFIEDEHRGESGIVYCLSRAKAESTAEKLVARGINARAYHAGMDSQMRHDNQAWFINTPGAVICATIAFGMGIDKPDVRFVAHIDMPKSIENYFQETGRAGRDGKPAQAWMCYGLADVVNQMRLIEMSDADDLYKRRSSIKLDAMLALAETVHCRRKLLLNYFGEEAPETCGNCDNCLEPPEIIDATVAAQKLVSCIWRCNKLSGHTFGARHIVDVLLGNPTEKVFAEGHDKLSTFGIGKDLDPDQWRRLIRQLIVLRILTVDAERYSALALAGGRASELLKGKIRVTMRKNGLTATKAKSGRRGNKEEWNPSEETRLLFEALRAWRLEEARRLEQPAYCIFWDSALKAIAQAKPGTIEEMRRIDRIGNGRIEKYGEALLEVIKAFEADDTRL